MHAIICRNNEYENSMMQITWNSYANEQVPNLN